MKSLRHVTPAFRVFCGDESLAQLAAELERHACRRAVVFCGQSVARHPDGLGRVAEALGEHYAGAFERVAAHSPLPSVLAGAETLRALAADAVIALGGGSAVVTARAASVLLAEGRDIHELCTQFPSGKPPVSPRLARPKLPQLVVATTPTTAYAKAGSAVLDPGSGRGLALFDPKTRACALFIQSAVAMTAPATLVSGAALNAFSMAVQGLESRSRNTLADALLLHALRTLAGNLRKLGDSPDDPDTRAELMLGALLAGQGTDYAPTGLTSALSHCVGARFHVDNGITNAVLLPHTMRFNAAATRERLSLIGEALGTGGAADAAIGAVETLFAALGVPKRLREIGVSEESLAVLAEDAAADWFLHQNPRRVTGTHDLLDVLKAAW